MLVVWRFNAKGQSEKQVANAVSGRSRGPAAVEVVTAGPQVLQARIETAATAESKIRVEISPKTSGRIEYLEVREGDVVGKGQLLARIDGSELQAQVLAQQANVAEAKSRLAQAQLNQSPTEVGIASGIAQQSANLASANAEYEQVQKSQESILAAADDAVSDAKANLASAEAQLQNARSAHERELATLRNIETRLSRIESLYRQGFIAAQEVDDAKTAADVQRRAVEVALGQVKVSEALVSSRKAQLSAASNQAQIARRRSAADLAVAKTKVDQAKAGLDVARANRAQSPAYRQNISALSAAVRVAEAQLNEARSRLAQTELRSPIDGVITARSADPGALATPGQSIVVVQSVDELFVTASVPIEESAYVTVGRPVRVTFDALPNQSFNGQITHVNPSADQASRRIGFRISLPNVGGSIKPGMYGRVSIPTMRIEAAVAIPREAVQTGRDGKTTVTVIGKDDLAEERDVVIGATDGKFVQIIKGLGAGERVVTMSYSPVRPGSKVSIGKPAETRIGSGGAPGGTSK